MNKPGWTSLKFLTLVSFSTHSLVLSRPNSLSFTHPRFGRAVGDVLQLTLYFPHSLSLSWIEWLRSEEIYSLYSPLPNLCSPFGPIFGVQWRSLSKLHMVRSFVRWFVLCMGLLAGQRGEDLSTGSCHT